MPDIPILSAALLAELRNVLIARRADLQAQLRDAARELDQVRGARAESADDEHDPEGSTLSSDWSRISGLRGATVARLQDTERALERMAHGAYGACSRCCRPVTAERLRARPDAEHCIECARAIR